MAEIEAVIRTLFDRNEFLQAVHTAQDPVDSAESFVARHARVVGMARHPNFVFLRHGDNALQEISDALPRLILTDRASFGERRILLGTCVNERAALIAAAAD